VYIRREPTYQTHLIEPEPEPGKNRCFALSRMKNNKPIKLSRNDVNKLREELTLQPETRLILSEAYRLPDGRVLVIQKTGKGLLWDGKDFEQPSVQSTHILAHRIPEGREFVASVLTLAQQLADFLGISPEQLDYSAQSLEVLDTKVFRDIGRDSFLSKERFAPLLAYVGEVIRRKVGPFARWEARLGLDGYTWEPWIFSANGEAYDPFMLVFEELHEEDGPMSFAARVVHIRQSNPPKPGLGSGGLILGS